MAEQISYLIIGNGIAGITAAETLRAEAPDATIGIITDDPLPVYYRPALKDYLAGRVGEERLWARPERFYPDQKILFLPERVIAIQAEQHTVQLQSRQYIGYGKLLLANGASASRLKCPGSELRGVATLRTVADYQAILARLPNVQHVVIVGSGTLALETAESLRARGLEVSHLLRRHTIWSEVLDATASDLVLQQELRAGIDVQLETEITEITGVNGEVSGVVTSQGKQIPCELVLVAIGVDPNVDFIRASNIFCGRGVQVDKNMCTSAPDIYAAGDLLETRTGSGRFRVLGQWYPAIQQARMAAYSMLGVADTEHPFRTDTFYNATFLYGLDFASVGVTNQLGYQEIVAQPKPRYYRKVLLQDGVPVGMLSLGERKQALAFKRAIDNSTNLSSVSARLFDDDFKLSDWLDAQGVPPLRTGVRKAGDTAVKKAILIRKEVEKAGDDSMPYVPNASTNKQNRYSKNVPSSLADAAEALLVHITEPGLPLRIAEMPLRKDSVVVIGRQAGVDLLVNEGSVSRQHAEIRYVQGEYELRDFGGLNGTFINDVRIEPQSTHILKPDDVIRVGNRVKFKFLLRIVNVAARKSPIEVDTGPLPGRPTTILSSTSAQVPVARKKTTALSPAGLLSSLKTGADTDKSISINMIEALKEKPGLIVMPEKDAKSANANKELQSRVFLLQRGRRVMIGREEGNDIVLNDMDVSRRHAEVFPAPDGVYIRDNNSSNGVLINQSKIERPCRLSHGDRIKLGNTVVVFVDLQAGREQTGKVTTLPTQPQQPQKSQQPQKPQQSLQKVQQQPAQKAQPVPVEVTAHVSQTVKLQADKGQVQMKICAQCSMPNMPSARFCARCSAPLLSLS